MGDETVSEPMITLVSFDKAKFTLPRPAAAESGLISTALGFDDDVEVPSERRLYEVELDRVMSPTLKKVVEFLMYYPTNPMTPIPEVVLDTFIENVPQEWYRNFCSSENMDLDTFFSVREAANFMDIKPLVYLTNVWLTFQVMGKSVDEIHELLNIPKMTEEQEEQARQDHSWIFHQPEDDADDENH